MEATNSGDSQAVTRLLGDASRGNKDAFDQLMPLVYRELRNIAHGRLRSERPDHTLNTTALVHEAYVRLVDQSRVEWQGRSHFLAVASEAMRRILIDYAKRQQTLKRGGDVVHLDIERAEDALMVDAALPDEQAADLIALDDALIRLAQFNADGARVVQCRFFGGLTYEEIAEVMKTSPRTARRSWTMARAWLGRELAESMRGRTTSILNLDPGNA